MATKKRVEQPGHSGRQPSLNAEHNAMLRAITQEQPRSSLDEVTRELFRLAGVKVSTVTVRRALREAGIERLKPLRHFGDLALVQGTAPVGLGYPVAPRRGDGASGCTVDTLGLLLAVTIPAASVHDHDAAASVVAQAYSKVPGPKKHCVDGTYGGKCDPGIK